MSEEVIEMRLVYNPHNRRLMVYGPLNNKPLCFDMLREAKRIIKEWQTQNIIVPQPVGIVKAN